MSTPPARRIQENAFSNCPAVRLLINGKQPTTQLTGAALADQVPNAWNVATNNNLNQNVTTMPGQVHWMVNWAAGNGHGAVLRRERQRRPGRHRQPHHRRRGKQDRPHRRPRT